MGETDSDYSHVKDFFANEDETKRKKEFTRLCAEVIGIMIKLEE